jgi:formylglycine-generating enzyme required for sulfatase activity
MAHDVFISYSSKDKTIADAACAKLESRNIRCWIAPRDVLAGKPFATSLLNAIRASRVFVLILSKESNQSVHVLREVSEAVNSGKPIIPFRIADIELSDEMHYYIKSIHWIDAMTPPAERYLSKLSENVQALLSVGEYQPSETVYPTTAIPSIKRTGFSLRLIGILVAICIVGVLSWILIRKPSSQLISQVAPEDIVTMQDSTLSLTVAPESTLMAGEPDQFKDDIDIPMVLIPAGHFQMGSNWGDEDEWPEHRVYLDAFYIDVYEVTNELYVRFMNEMDNQEESGESWLDSSRGIINSSSGWVSDPYYSYHPVVMVSWYGASAFCEWRGARLPTEAEWEKAARGGLEGKLYPWGDDLPVNTFGMENGAQYGDRGETTVPVGSFGTNGYGLYDMAGNVEEMVADRWMVSYYSHSPAENPTGPTTGDYHVIRGGSWISNTYGVRVSARHWVNFGKYTNFGFRCVRSP